eukprot:s4446_g3.t1
MGKSVKPNLLPGKLVRQHRQSCKIKTGRCGLCRWADFKESWQAQLKAKWAQVTVTKKVARIGCSICALADMGGPWANFEMNPLHLRLHHFKRHEGSHAHIAASDRAASASCAGLAPPMDVFKASLEHMRKGGSCRDGGPCSDKKQQVRWCLSEAAMEVGRGILKNARCIALTRDERKGRLLVRWRSCGADLSCASGVLGFAPADGFADSLAEAVKKMVHEYCTPRQGLPRGFVDPQGAACLQKDVEKNIRVSTSILVTDAAAPELLASGLLAGRRPYAKTGELDDYLSDIKVIGRDAPHATCRLLKRPFAASSELNSLMQEFISGTDSFAQKVFHSPLYSSWWAEHVQADGGGATSLAAAKHRFSSFLTPLSQVTDHVPSMIRLCHKIALVRGSSGEWATKLLQTFSGRKAALLAMATDAAATCGELTRALDDENADVSQLNACCQQFALSVQALFVSEKVWSLPTYAKALVEALEREPVCILHQGAAKEIRITAEDRRYATRVLQEWVSTMMATLDQEFPAWQLVGCFDVFHLEGGGRQKRGCSNEDALRKLAQAFGVNYRELSEQYVLFAYLAWTTSSSGCEQMFSQLKRSPAELASSRAETDRRLAVIVGADPQFDGQVLETARELYGQLLPSGRCRTSVRKTRMDAGRIGVEKETSKQAWKRKRSEAIHQAAKAEDLHTPQRRPPVELPESLEKEVSKQRALLKKKQAEAYLEGTLLDKEITQEVKDEAAKRLKTDQANDRARAKKFVQITKQLSLRASKQSSQWALAQLPEPGIVLDTSRASKDATLRKLRMAGVTNTTEDLRMPKLLLIGDEWCKVSRTHRAFGALMGCVLLSCGVLHGHRGVKMTFKPGVEQTVRVFASQAFTEEVPALTAVIRQACSLAKGWKAVTLEEATKKDGWKWGLVLRGQHEPQPPANRCKRLLSLTADEFVAWATRVFVLEDKSAWVEGR